VDLVAIELGGAASQRQAALLETVDAIGHLERLHDVLLDQDDAGAIGLDLRQRRVDVADDDGGEAQADLVAQQHARVGHERASDGRHLLLAARQGLGRRLAPLGEHGKQVIDAIERPVCVVAPAVGADLEVLLYAERRKQPPPLRHQRDARAHYLCRGQPANGPAAEDDAFGRRRQQADKGFQERRLAGAVGADDGERLTVLELEVDAVKRLEVPIERRQPVRL
jgi:hypothetical protein